MWWRRSGRERKRERSAQRGAGSNPGLTRGWPEAALASPPALLNSPRFPSRLDSLTARGRLRARHSVARRSSLVARPLGIPLCCSSSASSRCRCFCSPRFAFVVAMYIKSLTIRGFKTYRQETHITDLSRHVNMVLGKNGSGKVRSEQHEQASPEQRAAPFGPFSDRPPISLPPPRPCCRALDSVVCCCACSPIFWMPSSSC